MSDSSSSLDDVENPRTGDAGVAGWTAGVEGYLDDVLHLDADPFLRLAKP